MKRFRRRTTIHQEKSFRSRLAGETEIMLSDSEVTTIRARFPIFRNKIYVNSCSQGALSEPVEAALTEYLAGWHQGGSPWDVWVERYEEARVAFARLIGAKPEEVAVVASASAGINAVASALDFQERRSVVLGEFEFPTMGHIWLAQRLRGAKVEFLKAKDERIPAESYAGAIGRDTLIVPLTRVCFMNGFRSEVEAITRMAHDHGALVMLDDYQDSGTRPIDVKALGVDFFVTGTLKYLLGPPGLAFLYAREELVPQLMPKITGWFAQSNPFAFNPRLFDPAPTARRFEAGTPPIPSIYGALAGFELLCSVGLDRVAAHVATLARALVEGARSLDIKVKTPGDTVGPLVVLASKNAEGMVARLAEQDVVASSRHDGLRISFHLYNILEDVRAVLEALEENVESMVLDNAVR
ncbi:MAG: aminotransferase class V-fold PLP-dependent enzyme [Acidobacteria bacterium]|nr:aminotransferase class V-fold PLP-dependent enzyme [Acidobacteriota bacterium]